MLIYLPTLIPGVAAMLTRIDDLYVELKFQLSIPQNFEYDDIVDFVSENNYITEFRTVTN